MSDKRSHQKKAVVLLSGGLDSTTALYWTQAQGHQPYCLIFDYGQRHRREIELAERIAKNKNLPGNRDSQTNPTG